MAFQNDNVLTIVASNLEECKAKLYEKYGNNYRIIDKETVYVRGGFFGMQKRGALQLKYIPGHQPDYNENGYGDQKQLTEEEKMAKNRVDILKDKSDVLINAQLNKINDTMMNFMSDVDKKLSNISISANEKHQSIQKIEDLLEENEFTFSFIQMIEEKIRNSFSLEALDDFDIIERKVIDWIGDSISIAKSRVFRPPHVYIIVGPTGVGKTTTLVKMAVQFVQEFNKKHNYKPTICFITTDTMRVGAMEQLERWGKRMDTRVLKAEKTDDLISLYNENKDNVDAIFIDTSGYSPNDASHLARIKMLLDVPGMNPDIYLAVTASTKASDLKNIMKNYEPFGYDSVIITKCDESERLGNVISVLDERHKAVSYITTGQQAARDFEKADIVKFLINLEGFKVDRLHIEEMFGE